MVRKIKGLTRWITETLNEDANHPVVMAYAGNRVMAICDYGRGTMREAGRLSSMRSRTEECDQLTAICQDGILSSMR